MKKTGLFAFFVVFVLFYSAQALAVNYTFTGLGTLTGTQSCARAINENGQVVGTYSSYPDVPHAFIYDGVMHNIAMPQGGYGEAYGINDKGSVVGYVSTEGGYRAFLYDGSLYNLGSLGDGTSVATAINNNNLITGYSFPNNSYLHSYLYDGTMHNLGTFGADESSAFAINNSGMIAGITKNYGTSISHAFVYDGTAAKDLGTLGGNNSYGLAINNNGVVAGGSQIAGNKQWHVFSYDGSLHDLGSLGGKSAFASGLNDVGQIVGYSYLSDNASIHAFLCDGQSMIDLNQFLAADSGWTLKTAFDINNSGQIVGVGINPDGFEEAFLLTPIPEPATLLLLGLGGLMLRRKK